MGYICRFLTLKDKTEGKCVLCMAFCYIFKEIRVFFILLLENSRFSHKK